MERWQAERLRRVRRDMEEFISRCEAEAQKWATRKQKAEELLKMHATIEAYR